jgi:type I restriction enzyme M protein
MLNAEAKRHIDAARQVLVGKIPDPKGQVQEITNALVYKFMDDMDEMAASLGGKRRYFTGEYEQFSWRKIMDPKVGAHTRIDLYTQALSRLSKNPNLPELFRGIFRHAYLPFNDGRTLTLFLNEVDYFDYKNSEDLGNAYEYLLSIMGSQGDAGQFRTPRHIIDFIVKVINPTKDDSVLDPACGTAGFLISAYKHVMSQHDGKDDETGEPKPEEKPLTADEKHKLYRSYRGFDIDDNMVKMAQVNMYLHGFPNPDIVVHDTLSSEDYWQDRYDVIMANPPFMTPKGGSLPHNKFGIKSTRSEVLFVDYIMSHLKPNGRAGIIVPEGIIFQSNNANKDLRKSLIEDGLYAVVSLPSGVFNPYAGVKTSILLFDNQIAKKSKDILFVKIEADGFDLGAQRRPIDRNDLPDAIKEIRAYQEYIQTGKATTSFIERVIKEDNEDNIAVLHDKFLLVNKIQIKRSSEYNLSFDRYKPSEITTSLWPLVELGVVADFVRGPFGSSIKKSVCVPKGRDTYKVYEQGNVINNDFYRGEYYVNKEKFNQLARFELLPGDIVVTCAGTLGRTAIVPKSIERGIINSVLMRIRPDDNKILRKFLVAVINSKVVQDGIVNKATGVALKNMFATSELKKFKIPLPPLEIQKQIVEKIEAERAMIESNKKLIDTHEQKIKDTIAKLWNE